MTAGDSIRFFLRSSNTIVSGSNLYPKDYREETFTEEGDILLWSLEFENWTDMFFDNLEVEIYLRPDSTEAIPGPIAVIVEPEEISPGDTVEITFKRRYLDGTPGGLSRMADI